MKYDNVKKLKSRIKELQKENEFLQKGIDSRELFSGLKIASDPSFEEKLNKYNVIKLDLNSEYQNTEDKINLIKIITEDIKNEMRQTFSDIVFDELVGDFAFALLVDDVVGGALFRLHIHAIAFPDIEGFIEFVHHLEVDVDPQIGQSVCTVQQHRYD